MSDRIGNTFSGVGSIFSKKTDTKNLPIKLSLERKEHTMSVQHFKSLLYKSTQIQKAIEKEQSRRLPDWMFLLKLKKLRLAIKDRLQEIVRQGSPRSPGRAQPVMIRSNNNRTNISWKDR
jgi:uncharacterized protein YdcH (DUF465 family)